MRKAQFITLEGIEGVGKSTNMAFVQNILTRAGIDVVVSREPGGTPVGEKIRQVLLDRQATMAPDTELLLMFAARAEHIQQVIRPALAAGRWVLCDRFTDATYAYQGGGRQVSQARIAGLEEWVQGELRPTLTLLLDAPIEDALARAKNRAPGDRFETETQEFFTRTRNVYLDRARTFPERYRLINAAQPLAAVQAQIQAVLLTLFNEA